MATLLRRRKVSKKLRKHVQAEVSSQIQVCLLTIKHEDLAEPIRVSSDATVRVAKTAENVVYGTISKEKTYYYVGFGFSLPNDEDGASPQMQITLAYVTNDIIKAIENMGSGLVSVDVVFVFADSPDVEELKIDDMNLADIKYDGTSISFTLSRDMLFQEPYPVRTFIPLHYKYLFNNM